MPVWYPRLAHYSAHLRAIAAAVTTFARTTGDLKFLSTVDVHVLALTYMMEAEQRGWADLADEVTSVRAARQQRAIAADAHSCPSHCSAWAD